MTTVAMAYEQIPLQMFLRSSPGPTPSTLILSTSVLSLAIIITLRRLPNQIQDHSSVLVREENVLGGVYLEKETGRDSIAREINAAHSLCENKG